MNGAIVERWSDYGSGVSADNLTPEYRAEWMKQMGEMLARFDRELDVHRALPPSDNLLSRMVHSEATATCRRWSGLPISRC